MSPTVESTSAATLESPPKAGQLVTHQGVQYNTIREGLAHILVPPGAKTITDPQKAKEDNGENAQNVFYNPIQQFNRDLSVLAIRAFAEDFEARRSQRNHGKFGRREKALQKKQKQKEAREKKAAALETTRTDASQTVSDGHDIGAGTAEAPAEAAAAATISVSDDNPKKRKLNDSGTNVVDEKRQRLDGDHDESNVPSAVGSTDANGNALEPADASALPTGQRPDDKLRPHMRILDALSATGLRALRYASELPLPTQIVANDLLSTATAAIKLNAIHNKLTHAIKPITSNAQAHMYSAAFGYSEHAYGKYDVIDLDPYGTAVPFLEGALLALQSPGLLCVTCTDAGVFNSMGYLEKTYALYGGIPVKGFHTHEAGLRLILNAIATAAAKHGLTIEPLLSLSIDFYARVFVRVRHAPVEVKHLASKTMLVHSCDHGCGAWTTQFLGRAKKVEGRRGAEFYKFQQSQTAGEKLCEHCGSKTHLAGPMWGGPLHNPWFVERILGYLPDLDPDVYQTTERIEGMLSTTLEELEVIQGLGEANLAKETDQQHRTQSNKANGKKPASVATTAEHHPNNAATNTSPAAEVTADPASPSLVTGDEPQPPTITSAPTATSNARPTPKTQGKKGFLPSVPFPLSDPHPFYISPSALSAVIKCQAPPEAMIRGALRRLGYVATRTHAKPGMIKTQAPWHVIWDVMREWVRQKAPVKESSLRENSAGWRILWPERWQKGENGQVKGGDEGENGGAGGGEDKGGEVKKGEGKREIIFDEALGKDRGKKLTRYQQNPRANWGPMSRAKG